MQIDNNLYAQKVKHNEYAWRLNTPTGHLHYANQIQHVGQKTVYAHIDTL